MTAANYTQSEDFAVDILGHVLWQDDPEDNPLRILAEAKQAWYDEAVTKFWNSWLRDVFSLKTANKFGCVVWARILQIPAGLVYQEAAAARVPFGFSANRENFNEANFHAAAFVSNVLTVDEMRRVLRMRYYLLTISPTPENINYALADVFGDLGGAYIADSGSTPMVANYVFNYTLSDGMLTALKSYEILPRGAGVALTITNG